MDLSQIRYFLALARALNFTRAAEACNVTQPALTKSIQRLETELGGPLLLRERALTQLTELGRTVLPLLEQTYAAAERAKQHAAGLKRQLAAPLRVGFAPDAPQAPFMPLFSELAAKLPGFRLTLSARSPSALYDGMLKGSIDVGLIGEGAELPERMNRWPLFEESFTVIAPASPAMPEPLPSTCLHETALVMHADCTMTAQLIHKSAETAQAQPATRHGASTAEQVLALVGSGFGMALTPSRNPVPNGLMQRPVQGIEPYRVVLLVVAGRPMQRATDTFIRLARARHWAPT